MSGVEFSPRYNPLFAPIDDHKIVILGGYTQTLNEICILDLDTKKIQIKQSCAINVASYTN